MILVGNQWNLRNFETSIEIPCCCRMSRMSCTPGAGAPTSQDARLQKVFIAACLKTGTAVLQSLLKNPLEKPSKLYHGSGFVAPSFYSFCAAFILSWCFFKFAESLKDCYLLPIAYCFVTNILQESSGFCYGVPTWTGLRLWRIWRLRWLTQCGRRCRRSEI